jgi:hypothetical protein
MFAASPFDRTELLPRKRHRPRTPVSARKARLLPLLGFRYSTSRNAYVLRLVGNYVGPVFQVGVSRPQPSAESPESAFTGVS